HPHREPVPAHRVPARRLPQDRADRAAAAGERPDRPDRRPQDLRHRPAARRRHRARRRGGAVRPAQTRAAVSAATPYRGGVSVQPSEQHRPAPETHGFSAAPTSGWRHRLTARRQWLAARREQLRRRRILNAVYRSTVGVVGLVVVVIGIIAIPYPGPGWAIFFLGLALLATEFAWA